MKTPMKKHVLSLLCLAVTAVTAQADPELIHFGQLPEELQSFARQHFPLGDDAFRNAYVTRDSDLPEAAYTIVFTSGDGVVFRSNFNVKLYDRHTAHVPLSVLPVPVAKAITESHPGTKVHKYETTRVSHDTFVYEITLADGTSLTLDQEGEPYLE